MKIGKGEWLTIVGIAKDVKNRSLSEPPQPFFYLPLLQDYRSNMILVARTAVEPETMLKAVEAEVAGLDPGIPVLNAETMQEHVGLSLYRQRLAATLLSLFGVLALTLSAIGLYGVMTHSVSRRTRELGIRIAVGATHSDVRTLVLTQALLLCVIGITVGLIAVLGAMLFLSHLLYGVGPAHFLDVRERPAPPAGRRVDGGLRSGAPRAEDRPVDSAQDRLTVCSRVQPISTGDLEPLGEAA